MPVTQLARRGGHTGGVGGGGVPCFATLHNYRRKS
jgi:hypothetical protein